jgi:hypothetical protein
MDLKQFEIQNPLVNDDRSIPVTHKTETYDLEFNGSAISLINNGDNSWSLVEGSIDQETVNLIGEAIEKKIRLEL